jgi:HK97 family phage major capsid protein
MATATSQAELETLGELAREARAILDRAQSEGRRALTEPEEKEMRRLDTKMNQLEERIPGMQRLERREDFLRQPEKRGTRMPVNDGPGILPDARGDEQARTWVDLKTGAEIRALRPSERLTDALAPSWTPEQRALRLGPYLRGLFTGKWQGAELERRAAMTEASAPSAGYLIPTPLAAQLIDYARNLSVVMRAGAQTIPMTSSTLSLAKKDSDLTGYWYGEETRTNGLTESGLSLVRLLLQAKTLAVLGRASVELAEDAPNFGDVMAQEIAATMALELDRAVLFGIAASGWDGLRTWLSNDATHSINEVVAGAQGAHLTTFSWFISAIQKILEGNFPGSLDTLAAVMAPRTWGTIEGLTEATTNAVLRGPDSYNNLRKFVSQQLPITEVQGSAQDASTVFVGDFSQVVIGMRTEQTLEVSREGSDAFTRLHVLYRGYLRADWSVLQPKWLTRIVGITVA